VFVLVRVFFRLILCFGVSDAHRCRLRVESRGGHRPGGTSRTPSLSDPVKKALVGMLCKRICVGAQGRPYFEVHDVLRFFRIG